MSQGAITSTISGRRRAGVEANGLMMAFAIVSAVAVVVVFAPKNEEAAARPRGLALVRMLATSKGTSMRSLRCGRQGGRR
jgi:hypothetical protein